MDSNTPLWPDGISVPLINRRRRVRPQSFLSSMESRRTRVRRTMETPFKLFDVSWNFTENEYEVFRTFFIDTLEQGSLSFVMETLEKHSVRGFVRVYTRELAFLDSSYSFAVSDNLVSASAMLEVLAESYVLIEDPFDPIFVSRSTTEAASMGIAFLPGSCDDWVFTDGLTPLQIGFASGGILEALFILPEINEVSPLSIAFAGGELVTMSTSQNITLPAMQTMAFLNGAIVVIIVAVPSIVDPVPLVIGLAPSVLFEATVGISGGMSPDPASLAIGFLSGAIA